eukprot:420376_1
MNHNYLYAILLCSTNSVLMITIIISIQQFCITNTLSTHKRLRETSLVFLNLILYLIENSLVYLAAIYPNTLYPLYSTMVEALVLFIGFHTIRIFLLFIINSVYYSTNIRAPKWFIFLINMFQTIVYISIFVFYGMYFRSQQYNWIYLFYIILMAVAVFISTFIIILLQRPIKVLKSIKEVNNNHKEIAKGLLYVKCAICVGIMMICVGIVGVCINIEMISHYFGLSCDFQLINAVLHSVFVIPLSITLILWIYKSSKCCVIPKDSICHIHCCMPIDDTKHMSNISDHRRIEPLLHNNDCTSINTNNNETMSRHGIDTITTF